MTLLLSRAVLLRVAAVLAGVLVLAPAVLLLRGQRKTATLASGDGAAQAPTTAPE